MLLIVQGICQLASVVDVLPQTNIDDLGSSNEEWKTKEERRQQEGQRETALVCFAFLLLSAHASFSLSPFLFFVFFFFFLFFSFFSSLPLFFPLLSFFVLLFLLLLPPPFFSFFLSFFLLCFQGSARTWRCRRGSGIACGGTCRLARSATATGAGCWSLSWRAGATAGPGCRPSSSGCSLTSFWASTPSAATSSRRCLSDLKETDILDHYQLMYYFAVMFQSCIYDYDFNIKVFTTTKYVRNTILALLPKMQLRYNTTINLRFIIFNRLC